MKFFYAVLFYSILLVLGANSFVTVQVTSLLVKPSSRTNVLFSVKNIGKADKIDENECSSQNNTSSGFLKCRRTYFLTSVGIC